MGTHRLQRSPLMPLVVQKHLPLLGLHMLAWPLHLQAGHKEKGEKINKQQEQTAGQMEEVWKHLLPDPWITPTPVSVMSDNLGVYSRWQLPPLVGSPWKPEMQLSQCRPDVRLSHFSHTLSLTHLLWPLH